MVTYIGVLHCVVVYGIPATTTKSQYCNDNENDDNYDNNSFDGSSNDGVVCQAIPSCNVYYSIKTWKGVNGTPHTSHFHHEIANIR